jgi:hypothetical protein
MLVLICVLLLSAAAYNVLKYGYGRGGGDAAGHRRGHGTAGREADG